MYLETNKDFVDKLKRLRTELDKFITALEE